MKKSEDELKKENTTKYVRHNDIPTLYFHAKDDDFVPLRSKQVKWRI